jgi:hypothetical protein
LIGSVELSKPLSDYLQGKIPGDENCKKKSNEETEAPAFFQRDQKYPDAAERVSSSGDAKEEGAQQTFRGAFAARAASGGTLARSDAAVTPT